jgi:hypothetical protein
MNIEFLQAAQMELGDAFNWYETQQKNLGRHKSKNLMPLLKDCLFFHKVILK